MLTDADKQEILDALLDQAKRVDRFTMDAANEAGQNDPALLMAIRQQKWWWYPKFSDVEPTLAKWSAYAKRRWRFALGLGATGLFTAVISLSLPDAAGRLMFLGYSILIAIAASWQFDVSNRELHLIESIKRE